jgi:hypothetical protein
MTSKEGESAEAVWLPVIGKALAFLCMKSADGEGQFKNTLDKVDFLENLGLSGADAAWAAGTTRESVKVLRSLARKKKATKHESKTKTINRKRR